MAPAPPRPAPLAQSRAIAVVAMALAAALTAVGVSASAGLTIGAAIGAALMTLILWNPMVVGATDVSLGAAAVLGLIVVVVSYPIMLTIGIPAEALFSGAPTTSTEPGSFGGPLGDFLALMVFSMSFGTFFGLLATGWFTVPTGMLVAVGVAWWTRRRLARAAPPAGS